MSAIPPKNSRRVNRTAKVAPPGHPVPFTNPIGFDKSFILGHPCARNLAPSAMRPTSAAVSGFETNCTVASLAGERTDGGRATRIFPARGFVVHNDFSKSSAMSKRWMSSRFFVFAASSSMIKQNGQPVATAFAWVSSM